MKRTSKNTLLAAVGAIAVVCGHAQAREPGVAPQLPPGLTLGLPIAVNPPPGLYFLNRSAYYDASLKDNSGNYNGLDVSVVSESMQLLWSTGLNIFGATHKMFIAVPYLDIELRRSTPATGPVGTFHGNGFADPKLQPIDLSWNLGNGFWVGAAYGLYIPLGNYNRSAPVNTSVNFITHEPSIGFTYLKDGWNGSLQAVYDINQTNNITNYTSGDVFYLHGTLTKNVEGWNIGPVGFYMKQVTEDVNNGGVTSYGGRTFDPVELAAVGGLVQRNFGPISVTAFYTHEVMAKNTFQGDKFWLNIGFKLQDGASPISKAALITK